MSVASGEQRVLVTGGGGFVGSRFSRRVAEVRPGWRVAGPLEGDGERFDVTDVGSVRAAVAQTRPTCILHLAAVSAVVDADDAPRQAWETNLWGTFNVFEAASSAGAVPRIVHVSSSEVYGASFAQTAPVAEDTLLQPLNAYAASKAAGDILMRQKALVGHPIVVARPFNHIGAGQSERFALASFSAQIARIEAGLQAPELRVGDLSAQRDFLHVEDVVDAYIAMIEHDAAVGRVLNVASGVARPVGALLDELLAMSRVDIATEVDAARLRPGLPGVDRVAGDASAAAAILQWRPRRTVSEALHELLEHERRRVRTAS